MWFEYFRCQNLFEKIQWHFETILRFFFSRISHVKLNVQVGRSNCTLHSNRLFCQLSTFTNSVSANCPFCDFRSVHFRFDPLDLKMLGVGSLRSTLSEDRTTLVRVSMDPTARKGLEIFDSGPKFEFSSIFHLAYGSRQRSWVQISGQEWFLTLGSFRSELKNPN